MEHSFDLSQPMSHASLGRERLDDLRRRIGWLCIAIRFASCVYAGWVLFMLCRYGSDADLVRRSRSALLRIDLPPLETWQLAAGFLVQAATWSVVAVACVGVSSLFGRFLAGQVFSRETSGWIFRIGALGLTAEGLDILTRPLVAAIVSAHIPSGQRTFGFFVIPQDLLVLLFMAALIALGRVFMVAGEIADDNAQIV